MSAFLEIDAALERERYNSAASLLGALPESPRRAWRTLRIDRAQGSGNPIWRLRRAELCAEELAGDEPDEWYGALSTALDHALDGRFEARANALVERMREREAVSPRVIAQQARSLLAFDHRERARTRLVVALRHVDAPAVRRVLGELEYIEGKFDEARVLLEPFLVEPFGAYSAGALRQLAACYGATGAYDDEVRVLRQVLECLPDGQQAGSDRLRLAFAHASAGDYAATARELHALWSAAPESGLGRFARRRLDHLELEAKPAAQQASRRLPQFPTVQQKRDFCGPAVLELCLRYLGIELGQDEIAGTVKRSTGTPMYEIGGYLEAREILARRIEATPERLRAAIDLGLPVIVQEEYSTTSHVAVVAGYDAQLGAFIMQDPMTHRQDLRAYEWTEYSGRMFGNGAVLVIGRAAGVSAELLAALDRAGLTDQPHLRLLDDVDRLRAAASGEQQSALCEEVIAAADRALQHSPSYALAWARRGWSMLASWDYHRDAAWRQRFDAMLVAARNTFRGQEWVHRLHAEYLRANGRYREAFVEFLQAHRADPDDGSNLDDMARCLRAVGDFAPAETQLDRALACDSTHRAALMNLATLHIAQLRAAAPALEQRPTQWVPAPVFERAQQPLPHAHDELLARARFLLELLSGEDARDPGLLELTALLAAIEGRPAEAAELFDTARKQRDDVRLHELRAHACWLAGDSGAAAGCAELMIERYPERAIGWLWRAETLREQGELAPAFAALAEGVRRCGTERARLVDAAWHAASSLGNAEAAAVRLSELVQKAPHDPAFVRAVAALVDEKGQTGVAITLLRELLALEPGDVDARYRLGLLLRDDSTTRDEARSHLLEVVRLAPSSPLARQELAWCYLEDEPEQGLAALSPFIEFGRPRLLETAASLAITSGDRPSGETWRARALAAYETPELGRLDLATFHMDSKRYDFAADMVLPIHAADLGDRTEELQWQALSAARLSGRQRELLEWIRELARDEIPLHLASETYWAFRFLDYALAARAADVVARNASGGRQLTARIHAAGMRAMLGERDPLERLQHEVRATGWALAKLYYEFDRIAQFERMAELAERAHAIDPFDIDVLTAWQDYAIDRGDVVEAFGAAGSALERFPYQHLGDERLGMLFAYTLDAEAALRHSQRAVSLAPYCHLAHAARAVACFAARDFARAAAHAKCSLALEAAWPDRWNLPLAVQHALGREPERLEQLFALRVTHCPRWPFQQFDELLREVART